MHTYQGETSGSQAESPALLYARILKHMYVELYEFTGKLLHSKGKPNCADNLEHRNRRTANRLGQRPVVAASYCSTTLAGMRPRALTSMPWDFAFQALIGYLHRTRSTVMPRQSQRRQPSVA